MSTPTTTSRVLRAYIAGPLFDEGERWWIERVEQTVAAEGFITFLPHRDNPPKDEHNVAEIFANDRRGIDECDVVVASLNGIVTDDGTAWELGYAFAHGKPIIGLHTDWRRRFDHEVINLMIECSLTLLVRSLDDVPTALSTVLPESWAANPIGQPTVTTRGGTARSNTVPLVNIRETTAEDLPAALALNNGSIPALNEISAAEIERLLGMAALALTAEVDGAFAGFCITFPRGVDYASLNYGWFSRNYDDFVYLDRIAVDPAYRRLGIGKAFYDRVIEGFTGVFPHLLCEVNVRPRNEASLLFHHSIGFREVGQQDTDGGNKTVSLLALPLPLPLPLR